jgi:hypothetical protein
MRMLNNPRAIIAALGGPVAVQAITDSNIESVIGWKRKKTLPANKFLEMSEALRAKRLRAPPSLWNQRHYRPRKRHRNGNGRA